jgi:hypothetical protein
MVCVCNWLQHPFVDDGLGGGCGGEVSNVTPTKVNSGLFSCDHNCPVCGSKGTYLVRNFTRGLCLRQQQPLSTDYVFIERVMTVLVYLLSSIVRLCELRSLC